MPVELVLSLFVLPVLIIIGMYAWWVHVDRRFTVITHDKIFQSGAMWPSRLVRLARRHGIHTVFDFRGDDVAGVAQERRALHAAGLHHVHIPSAQHPSQDSIDHFMREMARELAVEHRVLMHCKDGEGRAVMYAALYRIEFEHWMPEQAYRATIRLPRRLRFLGELLPGLARLSERNPKSNRIRGYARRNLLNTRLSAPSEYAA